MSDVFVRPGDTDLLLQRFIEGFAKGIVDMSDAVQYYEVALVSSFWEQRLCPPGLAGADHMRKAAWMYGLGCPSFSTSTDRSGELRAVMRKVSSKRIPASFTVSIMPCQPAPFTWKFSVSMLSFLSEKLVAKLRFLPVRLSRGSARHFPLWCSCAVCAHYQVVALSCL